MGPLQTGYRDGLGRAHAQHNRKRMHACHSRNAQTATAAALRYLRADNLLSRGQEIAVEVDESKAVDVVLSPGEMSLHHVLLVHGLEPNGGTERRIGFAIRYLPTSVKQLAGAVDSATLVRGKDAYGHFLLEPAPRSDFHPDAVSFHAGMLEANDRILYRETAGQGGSNDTWAPAITSD